MVRTSEFAEAWLPLFDQYQVDLVVCGHDHDYERSFPVRGYDSNVGVEAATGQVVDTRRPRPVTTDDTGTFDTSQGTVFLVLGGGGTDANLDDYGLDTADGLPQAKVFTQPNRPFETSTAGVWTRAAADAREDAIWSARRDPTTGYGIGVFDVDPGPVGARKPPSRSPITTPQEPIPPTRLPTPRARRTRTTPSSNSSRWCDRVRTEARAGTRSCGELW